VMQRFTILAFLTIPLALFTSLVSIDFVGAFVAATPTRFWLIFVSVVVLVVSLVIMFKKKGWL